MQEEEEKKVSVSEALEALRKKRAERKGPDPSAPTEATNQIIPPSFWLDNLQDGVQKSRDRLFDSLASDGKPANGILRRDLKPVDGLLVADGEFQEFQTDAAGFSEVHAAAELLTAEQIPGVNLNSRFHLGQHLDLSGADFEEPN